MKLLMQYQKPSGNRIILNEYKLTYNIQNYQYIGCSVSSSMKQCEHAIIKQIPSYGTADTKIHEAMIFLPYKVVF